MILSSVLVFTVDGDMEHTIIHGITEDIITMVDMDITVKEEATINPTEV